MTRSGSATGSALSLNHIFINLEDIYYAQGSALLVNPIFINQTKLHKKSAIIAALKSLKQNDSIIILPVDKGRATVILNKEDYIRKCNEHLENGPYIKIKKDPINSVMSQITRKLSVQQIN